MANYRVAQRYAKSLLDLAAEQHQLDAVYADMSLLAESAKNRDLHLLMRSPIITASKKGKIFEALFASKMSSMTFKFLLLVLSKHREAALDEIAQEFIVQYKKLKHYTTVKLTSSAPLSEAQVEQIRQRLEATKSTDQHVEIVQHVDPSIIGGLIVEFDGKRYDASVAYQLHNMKKDFSKNIYERQI